MSSSTSNSKAPVTATHLSSLAFVERFVWGVLISLLCASLVAEGFIRRHVVPESPFYKQEQVLKTVKNPSTILVGDSHTSQNVVSSADMPNFGLAGENVPQIKYKLERILEEYGHVETVILQASPHMFAGYRRTAKGRRDYSQIWQQEPILYLLSDAYIRDRLGWYVEKYQEQGHLRMTSHFTAFGSVLSSYQMGNPADAPKAQKAVQRRIAQHGVHTPVERAPHFTLYRDMVADLHDRGVRVCLVEYPLAPYHRTLEEQTKTYASQYREAFRALAKTYGATYISYRDSFDDYRLFRNADHLNIHGAEQLTPRLRRDCGVDEPRVKHIAYAQ